MGLVIIAVLRSSEWGWILPAEGARSFLGMSPVFWFILGGLALMLLFMQHVRRLEAAGREPLVNPALFANRQMTGGLLMFFFQFMVMMGLFFVIPLYLSVALGLSAIETGIKITPLSRHDAARGGRRTEVLPDAPRRGGSSTIAFVGGDRRHRGAVRRAGREATARGRDRPAAADRARAWAASPRSSARSPSRRSPTSKSPEVGGLQNTASQFGASLGTALAGSILIAALTASFLTGIAQNPAVPDEVVAQANVQLSDGVPFISDAQLETALQQAGVDEQTTRRRSWTRTSRRAWTGCARPSRCSRCSR